MLLVLLTFIAGFLTVLAPCILPLLPVVVGGSVSGTTAQNKKRPYIVTASLVVSLLLFTFILKASTALIGISPIVWQVFSGSIVTLLGITMLFPKPWEHIVAKTGLQARSGKRLSGAVQHSSTTFSAIVTGFALGPVFSSCSPTYIWVLATVLPRSFVQGTIYLVVYCFGLAFALLAISLIGRRLITKLAWAANPRGLFQKCIAVVFILVGIFVATGTDKKVQTWLVQKDYLNLIELETRLVPEE